MDDRRFDEFTRVLAGGVSRRLAIKGLVASLVGGAVLTSRLDHAGAQCGGVTDYCDAQSACCGGLHCCYGQATNICADCCGDDQCPDGAVCENWTCVPQGGGGPINVLPATGAGRSAGNDAVLGAAAIGAAALLAASKLREESGTVSED